MIDVCIFDILTIRIYDEIYFSIYILKCSRVLDIINYMQHNVHVR